ncbi:hypothetical protein [Phyllobacterium leguminum]|nr:hypothetical protein [Phyllobacterium leguminum]
MSFMVTAQSNKNTDWRYRLSTIILLLAAFPIQIYAVPGFEITPSLILAAAVFLLSKPSEKAIYVVIGFLAICGLLALLGMVGNDGRIKNLIGAASFSSGFPYLLVGLVFASYSIDIAKLWQPVAVAAVLVTVIFMVDLYLTNGNLILSAAYDSVAYSAPETTFINSVFPFYGKYAVITLATIAMMLAGLSIAAASSFRGNFKIFVLIVSNLLMFISFTTWTRQVMLGVILFYAILIVMAFRRKETWVSFGVFLILLGPWAYFLQADSRSLLSWEANGHVVGAEGIGTHKFQTSIDYLKDGNFDKLSTGRLPLYRDAFNRITPRILLGGCGFCNIADVLKFPFSSLHNVILTAVFKGGVIYAAIYLCVAFGSLILLWFRKKSFSRDATYAVVASIAVQSLFNDVLYFQVVPALLFTLSGYLIGSSSIGEKFFLRREVVAPAFGSGTH